MCRSARSGKQKDHRSSIWKGCRMRELKKPPRGSAPVSRPRLPSNLTALRFHVLKAPPRWLEENRISRRFGGPFTMYRDPARVPLNSSSTGFAQDEHECLLSSDSSIAFPVSTTEQCATVTRLMPFRGWICPVVPSACAGPSGKPVGDDSFQTLCRSPKSFCRRRQTGPAPLWRR